MSEVHNPILGYADSYRLMVRMAEKEGKPLVVSMWSVITDLERNMAPLMDSAQSELAALREELAELGERYSKLQTGEKSMPHRVIIERDEADNEASALREIIRDLKDWRECSQSLGAFASIIGRAEAVIPAPGPLRKSLIAVEQRNAELVELLREVQKAARKQAWAHGYPTLFESVDAALAKPTESGANE